MSFLMPQQDSGGGDGGAAAAAAKAAADAKIAADLKAKKERELAYGLDSKQKTLAPQGTAANGAVGDATGSSSSESLAGGSAPMVSYTLLNNKLG